MLSQWKVNWGPILILCGCDGETVVAAVAVVAIIISSSHYVNNSSIFRSKAMHLEHHKTNTYLPIHCLWFHTHIHTYIRSSGYCCLFVFGFIVAISAISCWNLHTLWKRGRAKLIEKKMDHFSYLIRVSA